jgi:putative molybdopterin biosynthesis protein
MSIYLHDIPLPEARRRLQEALADAGLGGVLGTETIALDENALGRVLATAIWADVSSPHYHAAAMDGFAVRAEATATAHPASPVVLALDNAEGLDGARSARYVDTGDALPVWANAVVPIESVESLEADGQAAVDSRRAVSIRLRSAVIPWSHVRPLGEDIVETQLVLAAGRVLRPVDLGAIAAAGHDRVIVARKPRVAIVPTGTELVPIGSRPGPGSILEYNSLVLAAQVEAMGAEATRFPITGDDPEMISQAVRTAAEGHDLILLNAGSSAGAEDFSAGVIGRLGTVLVHGVAVRPGHPVILGMIDAAVRGALHAPRRTAPESDGGSAGLSKTTRATPIIGVPGYPVSAALTAEIFVEPVLAKWLGRSPAVADTITAELTRKITSPAGDEDYVRVALARVGAKLLASPLSRGAGVISSLVQADGMLVVPVGVEGIEAGEQVPIRLYRGAAEIEHTIFCIGSHDLSLDLIAAFLAESHVRFVSANVGSQAGLIALGRRNGHLAGSHLLDPQTGEYNISYIRHYMPGIPVRVVALAGRDQGLVVRPGNPLDLAGLLDIVGKRARFINRQNGAGTRVLLDYHLKLQGISPTSIHGYNDEEYTHLGVAAAVASGRADCGLAIAAAAQALRLDFIPLFRERYDLVIPLEHADADLLTPLLKLLHRKDFQEGVAMRQGYDVSIMGTVVLEDT